MPETNGGHFEQTDSISERYFVDLQKDWRILLGERETETLLPRPRFSAGAQWRPNNGPRTRKKDK